MAIQQVSNGSLAAAAATSVTVTLPSHSTGNLIVVYGGAREDSPAPTLAVSGYTAIGTQAFLDAGSNGIALHAWYKFAASGAESDPTITGAGSATGGCFGFAIVFSGVDSTTPLSGVTPDQGTGSASTTYTPPSITPDSSATRWVVAAVASMDDNDLSMQNANSFANIVSSINYMTTTGLDISFAVSYREVATSGAVGLPTYVQNQNGPDEWAYKTFVLRPDAGTVAANAITATATASGQNAAGKVNPPAGAASATAAAQDAVVPVYAYAITATATGTANTVTADVKGQATNATAAGAGVNAAGKVDPSAGSAAATGTANQAGSARTPTTATAAAAGVDAAGKVGAAPATATGTGIVDVPSTTGKATADLAAATATAHQPTIDAQDGSTSTNAQATCATATALAQQIGFGEYLAYAEAAYALGKRVA